MTREEAIGILIVMKGAWMMVNDTPEDRKTAVGGMKALDAAISALKGPTKEQVKKMRGEWIGMTDDDGCTWYECSRCEYGLDDLEEPNHFCPSCGAPMTDEAVDMLAKRLEVVLNA